MKRDALGALGAALLVCVVIGTAVFVSGCGSDTTAVPKCKPHAAKCRQTSDGAWIPYVYWMLLLNRQGLATGTAPAYRSSVPSSSAPPASSIPQSSLASPPEESSPSASPEEEPSVAPSEEEPVEPIEIPSEGEE